MNFDYSMYNEIIFYDEHVFNFWIFGGQKMSWYHNKEKQHIKWIKFWSSISSFEQKKKRKIGGKKQDRGGGGGMIS